MISQTVLRSRIIIIGEWRSLVSAPALGAGGRRFESALPDCTLQSPIEKYQALRYSEEAEIAPRASSSVG
jgi:hypothetical protein